MNDIFGMSTPQVGKDLSGVNMSNENLSGQDLSGVSFRGAILTGADLHDANLSCANLRGADLSEANLSGAKLGGADMFGTNLDYTDMEGIILKDRFECAFNILQIGPLGSRNAFTYAVAWKNAVMIKCGCFWDTFAMWKYKCEITHLRNKPHHEAYAAAADFIARYAKAYWDISI